jgi:hypothetical protein
LERKPNAHVIVGGWIHGIALRVLHNDGVVFPAVFAERLANHLTRVREKLGIVMMFYDTPIPYPYSHLMMLLVKLSLLLCCGFSAGLVAVGIETKQPFDTLLGYALIILANFSMEGLLRLHEVMCDPFGTDPSDIPVQDILRELWQTSQLPVLSGDAHKLPKFDAASLELPVPTHLPSSDEKQETLIMKMGHQFVQLTWAPVSEEEMKIKAKMEEKLELTRKSNVDVGTVGLTRKSFVEKEVPQKSGGKHNEDLDEFDRKAIERRTIMIAKDEETMRKEEIAAKAKKKENRSFFKKKTRDPTLE